MAYFGNIGTNNQGMINQLMRQKENIENMITQYSQPPAPVQTIINTGSNNFEDDVEFYAVMNMAWNDYKDLFKDDLEMYAKFSKAFISDIDAKKDKVYDSIVK